MSTLRTGIVSLSIILLTTPAFSQKKLISQVNTTPPPVTFTSVAQMVSDSFGAPVSLIEEFIREAKQLEKD